MKQKYIFRFLALLTNRNRLSILFFLLISLTVFGQNNTIGGQIIDSANKGVAGATIQIDDNESVITDENGYFSLITKKQFPVTVKIAMMGYVTQNVTVKSNKSITITMQDDSNQLDEILISSGYLSQKKSEFSGSVATVSAKQLQNRPTTSFDQLLGGQGT